MKRASLCFIAILCMVAMGWAQLDKASIVGSVTDASGAVVAGAKIEITNVGTNAVSTQMTDSSGAYAVPALSVGDYKVAASAQGFRTEIKEGIHLNVADVVKISFSLTPGSVSEQVTVTGQAPLLDTASSTYGGEVSQQEMTNLPLNGRGMVEALVTVPGVSMLGVEPSINGSGTGRLFEAASRILIDGTEAGQVDSDLLTGGYGTRARMDRGSVEGIAEVRIVQSSFSAEYGQAAGGVTNFITKSGTNAFHGSLFEFFRNEVLDAKDYFLPAGTRKPPLRLNQFGGSIGGPIKHDKLFFFGDVEVIRQREATVINSLVPNQAVRDSLPADLAAVLNRLPPGNAGAFSPTQDVFINAFPRPFNEISTTGKVDYNFSSRDRVYVRYIYDHAFNIDPYGAEDGQANMTTYQAQHTNLDWTHTFSPTVLNEAGFGVNRLYTPNRSSTNDTVRTETNINFLDGTAPIGPPLWDLLVGNTSFTALDTLAWTKGKHQLKFGTQIVRADVNKYTYFQEEAYFFGLTALTDPPTPAYFDSNRPYILYTVGNPGVGQRETMLNFFAQDDFQVTRNLTLNLGLRYQYETTPVEQFGRNTPFNFVTGQLDPPGTSLFDADKKNFGPRFGFAWTPLSGKSLVFRGGFGMFYTPLNPAMAQFEPTLGHDFGHFREAFLDLANCVTPTDPGCNLSFSPITNIDPYPSAGIFITIQRPYHTPYVNAWNFNIQQGLGHEMMLQVGYVGNHGVHYASFNNPNRADPVTGERPYPDFGDMINFQSCCKTNYNALQAQLRRRFSHGLQFNANYTYAHSLDQGEFGYGSDPNNNHRLDLEYASADYDIRHLIEFDYIYNLPGIPGIPGFLGKGWQINGISTYRSGVPVNITQNTDSAMTNESRLFVYSPRPNPVPGVDPRPSNYNLPYNQLNIDAYVVPTPAPGNFGTLGRNTARGPWVFNNDFSLFKSFKVREDQSLEFRAEMFNIFNTPQFAAPIGNIQDPRFGQSVSTIASAGGFFGSNRQVQFALKYLF